MTVMVLKEMGWETIPKENIDSVNLDEKEEKALSLALNKIAERRDWNDEKLAKQPAFLCRKAHLLTHALLDYLLRSKGPNGVVIHEVGLRRRTQN
jgi:hypothetical protein